MASKIESMGARMSPCLLRYLDSSLPLSSSCLLLPFDFKHGFLYSASQMTIRHSGMEPLTAPEENIMAASEVYYMNARSESPQTGLVAKMLTVFEAAGLDQLIKPGDLVAIKIHCGEWNNTAYLRPVYPRALADRIKELGGRPFVCDTTTLTYQPYASRATELDLKMTAERNGFSSAVLGCPFICADGFIGTGDYRVDIPAYLLKEAYIAQAIAAADVLICLTHFKGHPMGVIGGAIKNLGIGCQSKRGKHNVHLGGHPKYSVANAAIWHPENFKGKAHMEDWKILEDCCPYGLFQVDDEYDPLGPPQMHQLSGLHRCHGATRSFRVPRRKLCGNGCGDCGWRAGCSDGGWQGEVWVY